ncbi:hypothetical protein C0995_009824 [Termitomyces sp. Mi166|nr:hypothetical protein C0995_009824 [Termitomyces sp. Mi166\
MRLYDKDGFALRDPGSKKVHHVAKVPLGIHEQWSGDGHDKLYKIGPIWAVVDDGTTTCEELREYDSEELPAHVYLKSVHNISVERSWLRLKLDWADNAVIVFEEGATKFNYNDQVPQQ